ncbi:MAG: YIP1 family protein [Acidobacteria bacterium]|nr:YIP1 family protein [Acidobacteriota bacterium]
MEEEKAGLGSQLAGMFNIYIDPAAAVKQIPRKLSWLWPLALSSVVMVVVQYLSIPTVMRVMQQNPPGGLTPEQLERSMGMIQTMQKVGVFAGPLIMAGMLALGAALLLGSCSVLNMRASYRDLFSLSAHCSLISMLQVIAGFVVVRLKGDDIQSMEELQPAFGLGLFIHEGVSKPVMAVLNYFSIFTIWYIVILSLALACLTGASKGKGFAAAAPAWLLGLLFFVGISFLRR